jgi:hypothetical protein
MKAKALFVSLFCLLAAHVFAQKPDNPENGKPSKPNPPIPVEVFAGSKGLNFQMIVSKHFSPASRFGFFNVTNFVGDYDNNQRRNQYLAQSFLTVDVWKGISVNAGVSMNYFSGFRPSAGLQYVFANRKYLAVVLPRFDLTQTRNFETFALFEYKPMFTEKWGLYTRIQGLYNRNMKQEFHDRSYVYLRVGASYKNFQFGVGGNFDFYGPNRINENSFGGFVRAELF